MNILSKKTGYIDYNAVIEPNVSVYVILGQRSDGKTYGIIQESLQHFINTGVPSAYIRRFAESLTKSMLQDLVRPHSGFITKNTDNQYTTAIYKSKRFYLSDFDDNRDTNPCLYTFALNTWENAKGSDIGDVHNIIFDEFVSGNKYLPNEYATFENVISSIVRNRGTARIFLLGNPINQICPYFDEYNIKPHELKPGDVVYRKSSNGITLKFVYVPPMNPKKLLSAKFFDFGKSDSIKTGYWDFGEFQHPETGMVNSSEWLFNFAIAYRSQTAICDFYYHNTGYVFCVWRPATDIWSESDLPIFSDAAIYADNVFLAWERNPITMEYDNCIKTHRQLFATNKIGNLVKMWYNDFVRNSGRFGL